MNPPRASTRPRSVAFGAFDTVSPELLRHIYIDGRLPDLGAAFVTDHIARSTLIARRPGVQHLTVLREPRSRLLSHWLFWRGLTDEQLRGWGIAGPCREYRPQAAIGLIPPPTPPPLAIPTMAVRMLVWPHPDIPADGFIDEGADHRIISAALAAVETFAFADIVENPCLTPICGFGWRGLATAGISTRHRGWIRRCARLWGGN